MAPGRARRPPSSRSAPVAAALLVGLTFALFFPLADNGFVNYDDPVYVTANPLVQRGLTADGLRWAFTALRSGNWHPLTWLSHMADVALFGSRAGGHHLVGAFIHALTGGALLLWLAAATGAPWRSAAVAALFAVHPLHVESVAWAAERKDLLSALFGVLALAAYTGWVRRPLRRRYLAALLCFALSLMAKPMLVTLPLLLLLLDRWPLERRLSLAASMREKAPFFLVAAAAAAVALVAQRAGGAVVAFEHLSPPLRLFNALTAYAAYLVRLLWPAGLAVFYPHPGDLASWGRAGAALLLLAAVSGLVLSRRSQPWLLAGWAWYLISLLPVIGLVQIGAQAMADRYTYLPSIGFFVAVVWASGDLTPGRSAARAATVLGAVAILVTLAVLTRRQLGYWKDTRTLFGHALAVTDGNWLAYNNLGVAFAGEQRFAEAAGEYQRALAIKPAYALGHSNLGVALLHLGREREARSHFEQALTVDPKREEAHFNLALILADAGSADEAIAHLRTAVALAPGHAEARCNLGALLARRGDRAGAREQFEEALRLKPDLAEASSNLARLGR
jgi:Flp pilus assembly protein TadD